MQNLLSQLSKVAQNQSPSNDKQGDTLSTIKNMIPGGFAGGAAAGGLVALLLGSKSSKKMVKKVVKYGGTAVVGGLAYKAYQDWQQNKAMGQSEPVSDDEINEISSQQESESEEHADTFLILKTMIAAAKADGVFDAQEHQKLQAAIEESNLDNAAKLAVFEMMSQDISIAEIAGAVSNDEQKAEVYLAAYLAITVDDQRERAFLNDLAMALALPKGFAAYLEQQADQGVEN